MFTKDQRDVSFSLVMDNKDSSPGVTSAKFGKSDTGASVYSVAAMPVFRSGTFRNSYGEQQTWTDFHIQQIVSNFQFLRDSQTFKDVPVRVSHPDVWFRNAMEEVIGYVGNLRAEKMKHPGSGQEFMYLLADYDILDEKAAEKIANGLYRNRSAEISMYVDNNESEFYPVLTGFAYVDIPAVEGLNFGKRVANVRNFAMEKGDEVAVDNKEEEPKIVEPEAEADGEPEVVEEEPEAEAEEEPEAEAEEESEVAPVAPVVEQLNTGGQFSIKFNGQTINDPSVLQGILDALGGQIIEDRASYVNRLFSDKKITAFQKDKLSPFAAGLTVEQWGQFRSIYDDSPANPALTFESGGIDIQPDTSDSDIRSQVEAHMKMALGEAKFNRWMATQADKNKGVS